MDNPTAKKIQPFDGLNTSGSISRGITVGNNQNSVLNSNLDIQINGKLSEKVSLRASLQDSNIPQLDGGYSQKLDQFDNVFMELYSDKWNIRAGDNFLENRNTKFLSFNKKVQGIAASFKFGDEEHTTSVFASASLVKGEYTKSDFIGQEGNQGPYKLKGKNGELYVLVVSGSERVYVNGMLLKRGDNNDYTIDYNAGEIVFTSLFPITSEMRIAIEYQYSDRNYTRFVTYNGFTQDNKKWSFGSYLYSENDLKNQPLQQNLNSDQVQLLSNAGDNPDLMFAPSAYDDTYSENKVLYKKAILNAIEIFEYSNNPDDILYNVKFTFLGKNKGNYILKHVATIDKIYEYVESISGIPQGMYEPIIRLVAPTKLQVANFLGTYKPTKKTAIDFEMAVSNTDSNLFSSIDDANNKGIAGEINAKQRLFSKKWLVDVFGKYQLVQKNFKSVERLYTIEFNRDWNLDSTAVGNQSIAIAGLHFDLNSKNKNKGVATYQFEKQNIAESFSGNRQLINGYFKLKNWTIQNSGSFLKSDATFSTSKFFRNQSEVRFHFNKNWIGSSLNLEDNQEKIKATNQLTAISQRFLQYGIFTGRGDSTKVFVELGYLNRVSDSIQNSLLQRTTNSQAYILKSKIIQTSKSDLSLFINYRILDYVDKNLKNESSLNSRMLYNDLFFNRLIQNTTVFETNSGTIPLQEFTYVEVPVGQGVYTWNDYNSNGIQELQEFEIAPFIDQAKYIRKYLPNQVYIKTHQNKFSQSIAINTIQWQNEKGIKKWLSYFYNQTSFITDRKIRNEGDLELNPFGSSKENVLGLNTSFRNSLFYNRGKQRHSLTYSFLQNQTKNLSSIGFQDIKNSSNQLQYTHLIKKSWLFNMLAKTIETSLLSENYADKNYQISGYQLAPKISYLFSKNTSLDLFYEFLDKKNEIAALEILSQNRLGTSFSYVGAKNFTMNGELSFYQNKFTGNEFSSVGFQMLEGLQTGQNLTWRLLMQKNITQFLDININYQGRKSEETKTIHTGSVELRAYF